MQEINKDEVLSIAMKIQRIRGTIQMVKAQRSEKQKEYNDMLKDLNSQLREADEELRVDAVQLQFPGACEVQA